MFFKLTCAKIWSCVCENCKKLAPIALSASIDSVHYVFCEYTLFLRKKKHVTIR